MKLVLSFLAFLLSTPAYATMVCPEQQDIYELALADTQGTLQEQGDLKIASGACADMPDATYVRTLSVYKDQGGVESRIVELCLWGQKVYALITHLPRGIWGI